MLRSLGKLQGKGLEGEDLGNITIDARR